MEEANVQFFKVMDKYLGESLLKMMKLGKEQNKKEAALLRKIKTAIRKNKVNEFINDIHTSKTTITECSDTVTVLEANNETMVSKHSGRNIRQAAQKSIKKTAQVINLGLNTKLRRPTIIEDDVRNVNMKSTESLELKRPVKSQRLDPHCSIGKEEVQLPEPHNDKVVKDNNCTTIDISVNKDQTLTRSTRRQKETDSEKSPEEANKTLSNSKCQSTDSIINSKCNGLVKDGIQICLSPLVVTRKLRTSFFTVNESIPQENESTLLNSCQKESHDLSGQKRELPREYSEPEAKKQKSSSPVQEMLNKSFTMNPSVVLHKLDLVPNTSLPLTTDPKDSKRKSSENVTSSSNHETFAVNLNSVEKKSETRKLGENVSDESETGKPNNNQNCTKENISSVNSSEQERTLRSRTKVIKKAESSEETNKTVSSEGNTDREKTEGTISVTTAEAILTTTTNQPEPIKTRTKVREMNKKLKEAQEQLLRTPENKILKMATSEKENSKIKSISSLMSREKIRKATPLANSNWFSQDPPRLLYTGGKQKFKQDTPDEAERKRKEEMFRKMQKEAQAAKKREERLKATTEEARRKREEKLRRVAAQREATEKGKSEQLAKLEREREEREAQIKAEKERKRVEELMKKKQLHRMKAQEAEERRMKEETARLARIREQEEEQKRQAEHQLKLQLEAEKLHQQRQLEEQRMKIAKEKMMEQAKKKLKVSPEVYDLTPPRNEREKQVPKSEDDYGIEDANADDSSDDENHPKKRIPAWATKGSRAISLFQQSFLTHEFLTEFLNCGRTTPNLHEIFGENHSTRPRTSSACWNTTILQD